MDCISPLGPQSRTKTAILGFAALDGLLEGVHSGPGLWAVAPAGPGGAPGPLGTLAIPVLVIVRNISVQVPDGQTRKSFTSSLCQDKVRQRGTRELYLGHMRNDVLQVSINFMKIIHPSDTYNRILESS